MAGEAAASRCHGKRLLPNERRGRRGEEKSGGKKIKKNNQVVVKKCIRSKFGGKSMACN